MLFAGVHASLNFPDSIETKAWNPILQKFVLHQQIVCLDPKIVSALHMDAFQLRMAYGKPKETTYDRDKN